jgi:predicted AlkP superfamily pyrophosphatase or phosphodiesterase
MAGIMELARSGTHLKKMLHGLLAFLALGMAVGAQAQGQTQRPGIAAKAPARPKEPKENEARPQRAAAKPKLVVLLVVDQMRGDYVDKFLGQWTGGLKRLVQEGAWFRDAAYPYAATETCVGHATISTGALPATHGMIANAWWDRETQKMVTCTADPKAKNVGYGGLSVKGGDSAWRMELPSFADELRYQGGGATKVATFSLKARAAITMAGHDKANAPTWFDSATGAWVTSDVYGMRPFVEEYAKRHPVKADYGKTWALSLPESAYFYDEKATGAVPPEGWGPTFPHPLRGKAAGSEPDEAFYEQWATSPFADAYLTQLADTAVDALGMGMGGGTDFLGVGYSTVDYVGHAYGPQSREIQDILVRLDRDLGELFAHLDKRVGRGNYVVALTADHGVAPIPEDMQKTGADAGVLSLVELRERMEKALEPFNFGKPAIARVSGSDVYFSPGVYDRLKSDAAAMKAVVEVAMSQPGVAELYRAEDLTDRPATQSPLRRALAAGYFPGRSGDLFIVPEAYWLMDSTPLGKARDYGTGHGTPWNYDQHVPLLLIGYGVQPGQYYGNVTPADIAPTLASLCGITLAPRDGRVLAEALAKTTRSGALKKFPLPAETDAAKP